MPETPTTPTPTTDPNTSGTEAEPKSIYPDKGKSTQDFECSPYIKAEDAKTGKTVSKPKDMPLRDWEKQFEQGYLVA